MKLGLFLIVIGLFIGAAGAVVWQSGIEVGEIGQYFPALGLGGMVFGGGLFIAGVLRTVTKP